VVVLLLMLLQNNSSKAFRELSWDCLLDL
jgi:hypothetical protein